MATKYSFRIDSIYNDQRVDKVIASHCKKEGINISRSSLKTQKAKIYVNGREEKLSYITKINDLIEFELPEPRKVNLVPQDIDFEVIYSDDHLAVINKPAGLTVHIGAGHFDNTLVNGLLYKFQGNLSSICGVERPGIVHRLDKDTSGIMLVALSEIAQQKLSTAFKNREIKKIYYAIVKGYTLPDGKIELPIGRDPKNRKRMAVVPDGKMAITYYKTIAQSNNVSLVEIELKTGRTHQIRVHFSHSGHPVVGDPVYSSDWKKYNLNGIALISKKIGFYHPIEGKWMEFEIPFNELFLKLFKIFEIGFNIS